MRIKNNIGIPFEIAFINERNNLTNNNHKEKILIVEPENQINIQS